MTVSVLVTLSGSLATHGMCGRYVVTPVCLREVRRAMHGDIALVGHTTSHHPQYMHLLVHSVYDTRSLLNRDDTPTVTLIA